MTIAVLCPGCNSRLGVGEEAAGKTVKCPKCQTPMIIPAPEPGSAPPPPAKKPIAPPPKAAAPKKPAVMTDVVVDDDPDDRPRAKKGRLIDDDDEDEDERPRSKKRPVDDDDEDERPRSKKRPVDDDDDDEDERPRKKKGKKGKKAGLPMGLLIGGGVAALLLLAGGAFAIYWFGIREKPKDDTAGNTNTDGSSKGVIPSGWQVLSPPGCGFKTYVPLLPKDTSRWTAPPAKVTTPTKGREFECPTADDNFMFGVSVAVFPDSMSVADRNQWLADDLRKELNFPRQFTKESTRKTTLGGKEANELSIEVDMKGFLASKGGNIPKAGPKGKPIPDKIVAVMRYCVNENRGYVAVVAGLAGAPPDNDVKAFFDNFEFIK